MPSNPIKIRPSDLGFISPTETRDTAYAAVNVIQTQPKRSTRVVALASALILACKAVALDVREVLDTADRLIHDSERYTRPEWAGLKQYLQEEGDH